MEIGTVKPLYREHFWEWGNLFHIEECSLLGGYFGLPHVQESLILTYIDFIKIYYGNNNNHNIHDVHVNKTHNVMK